MNRCKSKGITGSKKIKKIARNENKKKRRWRKWKIKIII